MRSLKFVAVLVAAVSGRLCAQTTGATFGDVIKLGYTPSDVVLDESRGRLYLVNSAANRVDVYNYNQNAMMGSIKVGTLPFAAAMSMDSSFLYVTNNSNSTLSVIDLRGGIGSVSNSITLAAKPEGVEVGNDGRVLISTPGNWYEHGNATKCFIDLRSSPGRRRAVGELSPHSHHACRADGSADRAAHHDVPRQAAAHPPTAA